MICKVLACIKKHNMLNDNDSVIVALSGGADSMTLFSVLSALRSQTGYTLCAAHVNHCLRGEQSDADEHFVREVCERAGVPLHVLRVDVAKIAAQTGEGLEQCGRRVRYEFFESISQSAKIATAHTLSDNAETVLFNLTRGAALGGLCGIPPVRGRCIRPLIDCTRAEIEQYCEVNGISYVTDATNADNTYSRNRIRNLVVPQLKTLNPSFEAAVSRCVESLREDDEYLTQQAQGLLCSAKVSDGYSTEVLSTAHAAVRKRALRLLLISHMTEKPQKRHIDILDSLLSGEGSVQTQRDVTVSVRNGIVFFEKPSENTPPWRVKFDENGVDLPFGRVKVTVINKNILEQTQKINKNILANCLDYDRILNTFFKSREAGDKLRQANGGCTKLLKKLFSEKGIPEEKRGEVVLLADDEGILWVEGYGCDYRARITEKTSKILLLEVERYGDESR